MRAKSIPDEQEIRYKLASIGIRTATGRAYFFDQILVSDDNITAEQEKALDSIITIVGKQKHNYRALWIKLDKEGKFKGVTTHYSNDVPEDAKLILDAFRDYVVYIGSREGWKKALDHISTAFRELADFVRKVKIPEKYYNPAVKEYDSESFILYLFKKASSASASVTGLATMLHQAPGIKGKLTQDIGGKEVDFAYYCGIWNGLVEQLAALPEGAGWLLDMITNKQEARSAFIEAIQKLNEEAKQAGGYCNLVGQVVSKSFDGPNAALNAHSYGAATSQVLTFYLSVAKLGQASKLANLFNKLDAVGGLVNLTLSPVIKVLGASTKLVLKTGGRVSIGLIKGTVDVARAFLKGRSVVLSGKTFTLFIPFLPNAVSAGEELFTKIKGIKQFLRDGEGKLLQTEDGKYIVEVEYIDEAGNSSTMHAVVDEVENAVRHPNWVEVIGIRARILARKSHVLEIEINGNQNGFTACHSKIALEGYTSMYLCITFELIN